MRKLFLIIIILLIASVISVSAQASTSPLLQMLARIPDSDAAHQFLSYIDYPALIAARPGATPVTTAQQFEALQKTSGDAFHLYMSGLNGISSGPSILNNLFSVADQVPTVMGFDFFGVDQGVSYGQPPQTVTILTGNIDSSSVI
ncbi:MAG TPA: hypothetical protein VHD90_07620, partial [Phototrophicaceae bacterium]|nr:hypothetical protein [Phototrophicaceae bacterium]